MSLSRCLFWTIFISSSLLWPANGVTQCAIFFSETVRRHRGRQPSPINIPPLFVHMGLEVYRQLWLDRLSNKNVSLACVCVCVHAQTHSHRCKNSRCLSKSQHRYPPHTQTHNLPVKGEANQILAANQHFIRGAIWPSANCVSFKSLSISRAHSSSLFS